MIMKYDDIMGIYKLIDDLQIVEDDNSKNKLKRNICLFAMYILNTSHNIDNLYQNCDLTDFIEGKDYVGKVVGNHIKTFTDHLNDNDILPISVQDRIMLEIYVRRYYDIKYNR